MNPISSMKDPYLYIGLYALNGSLRQAFPMGPEEYHWAFIVAPKDGTKEQDCVRYRVRVISRREKVVVAKVEFETFEWANELRVVPVGRHDDIIARVLIAKVSDRNGLDQYLRQMWPEKTMNVKNSGTIRTSQNWVQRVLERLAGFVPGTLSGSSYMIDSKLADSETIECCCIGFARKAALGKTSLEAVPTFDLLKNKEVT